VKQYSKLLLAISALSLVSGCAAVKSVTGSAKKKNTPTVGNRIDILGTETDTQADASLANIAIILPPENANAEWAQPGGDAAKSPGHLALNQSLTRAWGSSIGKSSNRARFGGAPVVSGGKLFAVAVDGQVSGFDANTGAKLWSTNMPITKDIRPSSFGGGVSVDGGVVFATNGGGDVTAINAADGNIVWQKRPAGPLRGAPTIANGNVYVMTQDNQIYALRMTDGASEWNESGPLGTSGIFGVAAPAAAQGTIIAGYSTGELAAYRYENGNNLWNDTLSRTVMSTSVSTLTDIDASPVVDRGRVFALGQGGRMASYELLSGQRIWEINIAGISTPVVSGEWVFALTSDAKMLCIQRSSGKIRWLSQLPRYRKEKKKTGTIIWRGPVLASGRLIITNNDGEIWSVAAADGAATEILKVKSSISMPPIVANNSLYVLDDSGTISAFR
jgi:outer membrane protein assembly factor BamB